MKFPKEGVFRGNGQRDIYIEDFIAEYGSSINPGLSLFKKSLVNLTLILAMESNVMDEIDEVKEEHVYHRTVFLGTSYIQKKITNAMEADNV